MTAQRVQISVISALALLATPAHAVPIDTGTEIALNLDNTVQATFVGQPGSVDFGPAGRCFPPTGVFALERQLLGCSTRNALISSRLDTLSQLTARYRDFGFQFSLQGEVDPLYESYRQDPMAHPAVPGANNFFSLDDQDPPGDIQVFDAFISGTTELAPDLPLSFRIGRQVSLWGESLFFNQNGISAGQAPIDTFRYQASSAYYQADSPFLPVTQASFTLQPTSGLALMAYSQFEWRRSRLTPYDADDSTATILEDDDVRQIVLPQPVTGIPIVFNRVQDVIPSSSDQFGLGLRWQLGDYDLGLYGLSFNAKTPELDFHLPRSIFLGAQGSYALFFPKDIETFGASLAGPLGDASFGAEISGRRNQPLVNPGIVTAASAPFPASSDGRPFYPVGDTLQSQFSVIYQAPPFLGISGGANVSGEIAANDLLETTANANELIAGRTRFAAAFRGIFEPQFFQVVPRVDVTVPLEVGYDFIGLSEVDPSMNRGNADLTLGATATLDQAYKFALSFTHYVGSTEDAFIPQIPIGLKEPLNRSDFYSLTFKTSF
jgi:Protein of unknown function (DUF1302)